MEVKSIAQFMEVRATFKLGVDFGVADLRPDMLTGGALQYLDQESRATIAKRHGFDGCSWSGYLKPGDDAMEMVLRKEITVAPNADEASPRDRDMLLALVREVAHNKMMWAELNSTQIETDSTPRQEMRIKGSVLAGYKIPANIMTDHGGVQTE